MKVIELDYSKHCGDEPEKGHNRWHPDIPPAVRAEPGEEVVLQTRNAFDGGISPASIAEDLRNVNLNVVPPLTGPVYVEGAQPGDLLEVNILNIEPASWGFTSIIPGFGFLRDLFLEPYLVHWNISDGYAESADLPGVRVPGSYNSWPTRWSYLPSSIRSPGLRPLLLVTSVGELAIVAVGPENTAILGLVMFSFFR